MLELFNEIEKNGCENVEDSDIKMGSGSDQNNSSDIDQGHFRMSHFSKESPRGNSLSGLGNVKKDKPLATKKYKPQVKLPMMMFSESSKKSEMSHEKEENNHQGSYKDFITFKED